LTYELSKAFQGNCDPKNVVITHFRNVGTVYQSERHDISVHFILYQQRYEDLIAQVNELFFDKMYLMIRMACCSDDGEIVCSGLYLFAKSYKNVHLFVGDF